MKSSHNSLFFPEKSKLCRVADRVEEKIIALTLPEYQKNRKKKGKRGEN